MQVVVFGANGRVGRVLVDTLLKDGHTVRAFVHHKTKDTKKHPKLQVVHGDVKDPAAVAAAIDGADVVMSALGSWGTQSKDILTSGMHTIIPAMQSLKVKRIITLTGAGARASGDKLTFLDRVSCRALRLFASKIVKDGEQHIELLEQSKLDWTVIRSPIMRNASRRRGFTLSRKMSPPWATIVRQDVVSAMIELAGSKEWRKSAPFICHNQ